MRLEKLGGVGCLLVLLAAWEGAARAALVNPLIVPPLSRIFAVFWELFSSGEMPWQILVSMKRAALGYALAAAVFIPLGIAMGLFRAIHRASAVSPSDRRAGNSINY